MVGRCVDCGSLIADNDPRCPGCSRPNNSYVGQTSFQGHTGYPRPGPRPGRPLPGGTDWSEKIVKIVAGFIIGIVLLGFVGIFAAFLYVGFEGEDEEYGEIEETPTLANIVGIEETDREQDGWDITNEFCYQYGSSLNVGRKLGLPDSVSFELDYEISHYRCDLDRVLLLDMEDYEHQLQAVVRDNLFQSVCDPANPGGQQEVIDSPLNKYYRLTNPGGQQFVAILANPEDAQILAERGLTVEKFNHCL